MVISEMRGGFGNQLDAYSWGYVVSQHLNQELVLDVADFTLKGYFRPYCLDQLRIETHRKLTYPPPSASFMKPDAIPPGLLDAGVRILEQEDDMDRYRLLSKAEALRDHHIYLMGAGGGTQYTSPEELAELKKRFQLRNESAVLKEYKEKIRLEYSVAIHVRLGDFIQWNMASPKEFYQAAIVYVRNLHPNAQFYFFSNEIDRVKEQFGYSKRYHYVHVLGGMDADLEEFYCMSACNARIMSPRSSFSRWSHILSGAEDRVSVSHTCPEEILQEPDVVYLNEKTVHTLSSEYKSMDSFHSPVPHTQSAAVTASVGMEEKTPNGDAQKLQDIVRFSLDGPSLPDEKGQWNMELQKGKIMRNCGKGNLGPVERLYRHAMQEYWDDASFHADYFRVLYQLGRFLESAIHASRANQLGDSTEFGNYFDHNVPELKLPGDSYRFLRDVPRRHFIFMPMKGWSYHHDYVNTMAILLAKMGQKVTFCDGTFQSSQEESADDGEIVKEAFARKREADHTYRYHINLLPVPRRRIHGEWVTLNRRLLLECAAGSTLQPVAVVSHPNICLEEKLPGIRYLVPDICDPLNVERFHRKVAALGGVERYIVKMAEYADTVFLSGAFLENVRRRYGRVIHEAVPTWSGASYVFFSGRLDFTPEYLLNDSMILNTIHLLKSLCISEKQMKLEAN